MRELDNILNIEPKDKVSSAKNALSTVKKNYDMVFHEEVDTRFNEDFEEIRTSLKDLIVDISDSVSKLSLIAQDTEKAAHFSALSQLTTTLLNANKQLLEIYSEKKKYNSSKNSKADFESDQGNINVQNAIFTGTTADLKKWIEDMKS